MSFRYAASGISFKVVQSPKILYLLTRRKRVLKLWRIRQTNS
jgi:hypothetical protein